MPLVENRKTKDPGLQFCSGKPIAHLCVARFQEVRAMHQNLDHLLGELGIAIKESLAGDPRVTAALNQISRAGHQVLVCLNATIRVATEEMLRDSSPQPKIPGTISLTEPDKHFLRLLKIDAEN